MTTWTIHFYGGTSTEFVGSLHEIEGAYDQDDIAKIVRVR